MAKKGLEKLEAFEDIIEFADANEVDVSMYDADTPIEELRDYIRNAIATKTKDGDDEMLSTQNAGDGDEHIPGGDVPKEPDVVPEAKGVSNQNDRSGDTGPHAAPDDNDAEKAIAAKSSDVSGAVRYLAGLVLSQSQMIEFINAFPGLYK